MKEEEQLRKMQEESANTSFDIVGMSSETNILYRINTPFQITYEACSGTNATDYLNIWTLSPNGISTQTQPISLHNYAYHNMPAHNHNFYEFMIVLKGSVRQQIEGVEYLYSEGSACLINKNLKHKEIFNDRSQILFLGLTTEMLTKLFHSANKAYYKEESSIFNSILYKFIQEDIKHPGRKAYLDFFPALQNKVATIRLHQNIEDLMHTLLFPTFGSSLKIDCLFCELIEFLVSTNNYHCSTVKLGNNSDYLLFLRIEHLLIENNGRVSRTELSNALCYSGDYLNRIVNKYTGKSLHKYGMDVCIKAAAHELKTSTKSISDIVEELNFSNRTYFYQQFQNHFGMTPKEYRRIHSDENT